MPKVYVVCEPINQADGRPRVNLTPALRYGELEVLLTHSQSLLAPVPTIRKLREKLRDFSDDDYLLPVGDPVLMCTVAAVAAHFNNGRVKYLKWDKIERTYFVIQTDISGAAQ